MNGKKLLVFSDTHGGIKALKGVMNWAKDHTMPDDTICAAAFLGDGIRDLKTAADATGFFCEWNIVRGNNDHEVTIPETVVFDFSGHNFLMCHGHRHSLYGGYHSLTAAARNSGAGAVLFGHTHVPCMKTAEGVLLVNPGSVGRPRSRIGATFAVIECVPGEPLEVTFYGISGGETIRKLEF